MQRLGDIGSVRDMQAIIARIRSENREREANERRDRERQRRRFLGDCPGCLDTGRDLDDNEPCQACPRGRALAADLAEQEVATRRSERLTILRSAGVPETRWNQTLESYARVAGQSEPLAQLVTFLRGWDGKTGLILTGCTTGTGKTGLLYSALQHVAGQYVGTTHRIRAMHAAALFDGLRYGVDDGQLYEFMCELSTVRLLAIDDLGAERASDWTRERLCSIIENRMMESRPIFLTTNYTLDQLEAPDRLGRRIVDRLDETCDLIRVEGPRIRVSRSGRRG